MHISKVTLLYLFGLMVPAVVAMNGPVNQQINPLIPQVMEISHHRPITISEVAILRQKKQLDSLFYWNKIVRYSTTGIMGGFAAYYSWQGLKWAFTLSKNWWFSTPKEKNPLTQAQYLQIQTLHQKIQGILNDGVEIPDVQKTAPTSLLQFGSTVMPTLSGIVLSYLASQHLSKLFYFKDMEWFVAERTHLLDALEELQIHAAAFDGRASLPDYKATYSTKAFEEILRDVVLQIEKILGFMEHLIDQEVARQHIVPGDLHDTPRVLMRVVNDFCLKMHDVLVAYHTQKPVVLVTDDVLSFSKEVQQIIGTYKHFNNRVEMAQQALIKPLVDTEK